MQFIRKINTSRIVTLLLLAAVFVVMLVGNMLTDKCADDFLYTYSFADGEPVRSVSTLLDSMRAHAYTMNGRLIAHAFVQIFENLPKTVFNVINAAVFALSLCLLYRLCRGKETNNLFLLTLFSAVWVFEPGFGQVNFWLDGSCNYLWAQIPAFLFLLPFVRLYEGRKNLLQDGNVFIKALFALGAVCMGAYLENLSGAAIFMAILFVLLVRFAEKRKVPPTAIASIIFAVVGYACMVFAPAERSNKSGGFSLIRLLYQFGKVTDRFYRMRPVLIAFVVLLFAALALRADKKRILLSAVFACGAMGAGLIFTLSRYYPVRCMAAPALLFIAADGILLLALSETEKAHMACLCVSTLVCLSLFYWCPFGIQDMYLMHEAVQENIQTIEEKKALGEREITLPVPVPQSQYCAFYQLEYLSDDPDHFANANMAKYYGVERIYAEQEE